MKEFPRRIREGRRRVRLTGQELARRVGVSPSYISLIEKGLKTPSEDVAVLIAATLGESEEEFRVWAATTRMSPRARAALRSREEAAGSRARRELAELDEDALPGMEAERVVDLRSPFVRVDEGLGAEDRVSGEDWFRSQRSLVLDRAVVQEQLFHDRDLLRAALVRGGRPILVPLLADGVTLEEESLSPRAVIGAVPVAEEHGGLAGREAVALTVTAASCARVSSVLHPGDVVVIDRRWSGLRNDAIYAVRLRSALVLSRCLLKGRTLLLPSDAPLARGGPAPAPAGGDVEVIDLPEGDEDLQRLIAGRVVLSLRIWK